MEAVKRRYVGIDLGKREWTMAILGTEGKMKVHHGKTSPQGRQKLYELLEGNDKIALEAGTLAFRMGREIQERVGSEVRVLNSGKLPSIWAATTKTDKEDAMKLAHLVEERRDEQLPIVPIPSAEELERRYLLSSYRYEQHSRTKNINRLHALFERQGLTTIVKKELATEERRREAVMKLSGRSREEAEWLMKHLELNDQRIKGLKDEIRATAKKDEDIKRLETVAGVGPVVAYAFTAYVGDGSRFERGDQVSNYLGLVPRLDYSGTIQRQGHITKRGNGYVRALLVQAAWSAVRSKKGGALRERYIYMTKTKSMSKKKSIVAISRRLAKVLFSILKNKTSYQPQPWTKERSLKDLATMALLT